MPINNEDLERTLLKLLIDQDIDRRIGKGKHYLAEKLRSEFPDDQQPTAQQFMQTMASLIAQGLAFKDESQSAPENWQLLPTTAGLAKARGEDDTKDAAESTKLKVFLSYSSNHQDIVAQIKRGLEEYGLIAFLAHEDIEPAQKWLDVILAELKTCDVFIPILTEDFGNSKWTDQETGIAFILDKLIIPIKMPHDPYGFISDTQALKMHIDPVYRNRGSFLELANVIAADETIGERFRANLITEFGESSSWDGGASKAELLSSLKGYTSSQLNVIVKHIIENDQIHNSFEAQPILRTFIRKYKNSIDPELFQALPYNTKP